MSFSATRRVEMGPMQEQLEGHCAPQGLRLHWLQRLPFLQHLQDIPPKNGNESIVSCKEKHGDVDDVDRWSFDCFLMCLFGISLMILHM